MTARIIDGKALAHTYREEISRRVAAVRGKGGRVRLDAVLVGTGDTAARVYAERQGQTCAELGIEYRLHRLSVEAGQALDAVSTNAAGTAATAAASGPGGGAVFDAIAGRVLLLNAQDDVSAIMVHMPLPEGVDPYAIQRLIDPEKDVEGVKTANIGNVVYGRSSLAPCTALAAVKMIESTGEQLRGKTAVVVGASNVVGKPIAVLLMRQDATVVSCNKWTDSLETYTRRADVLVAAAGVPKLITAGMVKPGAIVIDVGVNRVPDPAAKTAGAMKTVGDVDFDAVKQVAGWLSPVPGGVGPMTVAMLLLNVVEASEPAGFRHG
jgi:methylenetetrahydrofolate dehydrogenase (NADP+) / methenyltetrahydrofolate cyclohydrolase